MYLQVPRVNEHVRVRKLRDGTVGFVHTLSGCTCERQGKEPLVCTRETHGDTYAASLTAPAGPRRGYGRVRPPWGGAETHQNRIHQMSRPIRDPTLFFPRATMSRPLTTSGRRRCVYGRRSGERKGFGPAPELVHPLARAFSRRERIDVEVSDRAVGGNRDRRNYCK